MPLTAALFSALFNSAKDLVSKRLAFSVSAATSAFASFAFALPYYLAALIVLAVLGRENLTLTLSFIVLVTLRSVTDTGGEYCKMHALSHGDISLVSPLISLAPVFMLFVSPVITGDPLTPAGAVAVMLVVAGTIVLVYKPRGSHAPIDKRAILYALGTSLFFALNSCFDRLAVQQASPLISGFAMTLLACLFLLPVMRRQPNGMQHLTQFSALFALRGLFETLFMVLKLYALQSLQAPYVAALLKISLLLSIVGGKVLFGEKEMIRRLAAGLLILCGVGTIVFSELLN